MNLFYILTSGFSVSAEDGGATHQEADLFAEFENVNDIQEDMLNDIYDKATEVSTFTLNKINLLSCNVFYVFVKTHLNVLLGERSIINIYLHQSGGNMYNLSFKDTDSHKFVRKLSNLNYQERSLSRVQFSLSSVY